MTLKEIAKLTGYDISTVSRALNDSNRVKIETKQYIQQVARDSGYYRDDLARSLVSKSTQTIGIVVPEFVNTYYAELINGFEEVLSTKGYTLLFGKSNFDIMRVQACMDTFLRKKADGIIVCSVALESLPLERYKSTLSCLLFVDTPTDCTTENCISVDNEQGVRNVIEHLHTLGHRKIAFIGDDIVIRTRLDPFKRIMSQFGMSVPSQYIAVGTERFEQAGYLRMRELLQLSDPPTAVFAATDNLAIGAIHAVKMSGLRIPTDISIVGFDNISTSSYISPRLTTVDQPKQEMGRIAAQRMLAMLSGEIQGPFHHKLKPTLIVRETTGPLK